MSPLLDMQLDDPPDPGGCPHAADAAMAPSPAPYAPFSHAQTPTVPLELIVQMLGYLGASDLRSFARCCTFAADQALASNDERLWRPLVDAVAARAQRHVRASRGGGGGWRGAYAEAMADLRRPTLTAGDVVGLEWRLRFTERASGAFFAAPHEPRFLEDGTLLLRGYPRLPWSVADGGRVVVIAQFPPHAVGRRSGYDGAWTLANENVTMWTVDEACAARHARAAAAMARRGDAHLRAGRARVARLEYRTMLGHCGGIARPPPPGDPDAAPAAPGSPWSRYRRDPGAEAIEAEERALTATLTAREREVRTAALGRLAGAALECGRRATDDAQACEALVEALDCARRALATHIDRAETSEVIQAHRDAAVAALHRVAADRRGPPSPATPDVRRARADSSSEAPTRSPSPVRDAMDESACPPPPGTDFKSVLSRLFEWAASTSTAP